MDDDEEGDSDSLYTVVRLSTIHDKGVFATRQIQQGTVLYTYEGELISRAEALLRLKKDMECGITYLFECDNTHDIDGSVGGNDSIYLNHCCEPNCNFNVTNGKITIYAKRTIKPGEELTYDYDFAPNLGALNAPCKCGAPQCRGFIVAKDCLDIFKRQLLLQTVKHA